MPLVWVAVAIALMLALMLAVRLDAFLALLLTSLAVRLLAGMDVLAVRRSILRGVGGALGSVALILVFGVAALVRLAVGSATVAGMTTAGMMAPTVLASGVRPELMVLATGAVSLMFSHVDE